MLQGTKAVHDRVDPQSLGLEGFHCDFPAGGHRKLSDFCVFVGFNQFLEEIIRCLRVALFLVRQSEPVEDLRAVGKQADLPSQET